MCVFSSLSITKLYHLELLVTCVPLHKCIRAPILGVIDIGGDCWFGDSYCIVRASGVADVAVIVEFSLLLQTA